MKSVRVAIVLRIEPCSDSMGCQEATHIINVLALHFARRKAIDCQRLSQRRCTPCSTRPSPPIFIPPALCVPALAFMASWPPATAPGFDLGLQSIKADELSLLQWDRAISSLLIRSGLGFGFGVIFSVLLFKRRAWPVWLGTGFGAGRAWEEADGTNTTLRYTRPAVLTDETSQLQARRSASPFGRSSKTKELESRSPFDLHGGT
jgi:Domain of unknown function (DUF543)